MSIPFALSLSKYVNSTGTDVGFASLLGVALLALLYFAGARETRTLRDQLEEAHSRLSSLETRIAQALRSQTSRAGVAGAQPGVVGRPGVVPAPTVGPMGSAVARVQREAGATAGVAAAAPAELVGAAMSLAAPSLGSATKLIPTPMPAVPAPSPAVPAAVPAAAPVAPAAAPVPAMPAPATAIGAAAYATASGGGDDEFEDDFEPEDTMLVPAAQTAAATNGKGVGAPAVAPPPRVLLQDSAGEEPGPVPRRTIPTVDTGPSRSRLLLGRLGGSLAAVVLVAVIVVALLLITSSGGSKHKHTTAQSTHTQTTAKKKTAAFQPSQVAVSVLNGTATQGLATDIGAKLTSGGYKVPSAAIANDGGAEQVNTTTVSYLPGYLNAATHVADLLHTAYAIPIPQISAATSASINDCATPVATGVTGTCPAKVIVTVGNDLAGVAATSTTSG